MRLLGDFLITGSGHYVPCAKTFCYPWKYCSYDNRQSKKLNDFPNPPKLDAE